MRTRGIAQVALAVVATTLLAACGGSSGGGATTSAPPASSESASSTLPPAPTVPADGGMTGTWSATDPAGTISIAFDQDGTSATAAGAQACLTAMKGKPVTWLVITTENTSGKQFQFYDLTVVTGDGTQLRPDNAISTMNDLYGDASDSAAREACVATAQALAKVQLENGLAPGAKAVVLQSLPASVTSIKSVTAGGTQPLTLTYSS